MVRGRNSRYRRQESVLERITLEEARANLEDVLQLVGRARQRFVIRVAGKDQVAFVSLEDLALLERLDGDAEVPKEYVEAADLRKHLAEDIALVAKGRERIVVREEKSDFVALVPSRDVQALEQIDTRLDIEAAKRLLQQGLKRRDDGDDEEDD